MSQKSTPKSTPKSSGRRVLLLCTLGLAVVAVGLSYCVHLGASREADEEPRTAAEFKVVSPDGTTEEPTTPAAVAAGEQIGSNVSRGKVLFGAVVDIDAQHLTLRLTDGRQLVVDVNGETRYESMKAGGLSGVRPGDMVVVHAMARRDEMTADLVIDSRISAGMPTG